MYWRWLKSLTSKSHATFLITLVVIMGLFHITSTTHVFTLTTILWWSWDGGKFHIWICALNTSIVRGKYPVILQWEYSGLVFIHHFVNLFFHQFLIFILIFFNVKRQIRVRITQMRPQRTQRLHICIYIYIYMRTCTYIYKHTHTHRYMHIYMAFKEGSTLEY